MFKILNKATLPPLDPAKVPAGGLRFNYLLGIAMLYLVFPILTWSLMYKFISWSIFVVPAGMLVSIFSYMINNITTEVYGYEIARNMMWWFICAAVVLVSIGFLLISAPTPPTFCYQQTNHLFSSELPRICLAGCLGSLVGFSFNNYFISKLKLFFHGKAYWLRSMLATTPSEILYNLIAFPILFCEKVSVGCMGKMFLSVMCFNIIVKLLIIPAEFLITDYLKKKEKINTFDDGVNYNMFGFYLSRTQPILKVID